MTETAIFLSPHNDDAALFGAFTVLRHRPLVVTVLRSRVQERYGITAAERELEDAAAMKVLGAGGWQQWTFEDADPNWSKVRAALRGLGDVDLVFAPAIEDDGHGQHNRIGELADEVFGPDKVTHYLTYTRKNGKSTAGILVEAEPDWMALKLQALACYRSQVDNPKAGCAVHFYRDQQEYFA